VAAVPTLVAKNLIANPVLSDQNALTFAKWNLVMDWHYSHP